MLKNNVDTFYDSWLRNHINSFVKLFETLEFQLFEKLSFTSKKYTLIVSLDCNCGDKKADIVLWEELICFTIDYKFEGHSSFYGKPSLFIVVF